MSNSFTQDDLSRVWKQYLTSIEKSNASLHSILLNHPPTVKSENVIDIRLLVTQKTVVESEKTELISFLRKELKNSFVSINIVVIQPEDEPQKAFTATDKFKLMIKKNPVLGEMKTKFGLDLD